MPREREPTAEEFAEALAFSKAFPQFSFSSDEMAALLLRRRSREGDGAEPTDAESEAFWREREQRVQQLCKAEGILFEERYAKLDAKDAAASAAWTAWKSGCAARL